MSKLHINSRGVIVIGLMVPQNRISTLKQAIYDLRPISSDSIRNSSEELKNEFTTAGKRKKNVLSSYVPAEQMQ